jgi:hypothetical protein
MFVHRIAALCRNKKRSRTKTKKNTFYLKVWSNYHLQVNYNLVAFKNFDFQKENQKMMFAQFGWKI